MYGNLCFLNIVHNFVILWLFIEQTVLYLLHIQHILCIVAEKSNND